MISNLELEAQNYGLEVNKMHGLRHINQGNGNLCVICSLCMLFITLTRSHF